MLAEPASTHALPALSARAKSTPSTPMYAFPAAVAQMFAPAVLSPRDKQSVKATRTINLSANLPPYHRGQVVFLCPCPQRNQPFCVTDLHFALARRAYFPKKYCCPAKFWRDTKREVACHTEGRNQPFAPSLAHFLQNDASFGQHALRYRTHFVAVSKNSAALLGKFAALFLISWTDLMETDPFATKVVATTHKQCGRSKIHHGRQSQQVPCFHHHS